MPQSSKTKTCLGISNLVFRTEPLIGSVMGDATAASYVLTLVDEGRSVYGMQEPSLGKKYATERLIEASGRSWIATITPRDGLIGKAQSLLDEALLIAGLILAVIIAVTLNESERNKRKIKDREERLALAMEGTSDGLYDINVETLETYFSPRWYQMLGYKPDDLPATYEKFMSLLHPNDAAKIRPLEKLLETKSEMHEIEFRMRRKKRILGRHSSAQSAC